MKTIPLPPGMANIFRISLFSLLFVFTSCKVQFIPNYDAELSQEISATAKKIDNFYLTLKDIGVADRQYNFLSEKYIDIEVDLNSILAKNRVRPLNSESTRIAEITLQLWEKYKEEHKKDNTLSDGLIKLNRKTLSDMFYAMQVAEEAKKVSGTP